MNLSRLHNVVATGTFDDTCNGQRIDRASHPVASGEVRDQFESHVEGEEIQTDGVEEAKRGEPLLRHLLVFAEHHYHIEDEDGIEQVFPES